MRAFLLSYSIIAFHSLQAEIQHSEGTIRYQHVSWERLLSGEGLVNLAEALSHLSGMPIPEPVAHAIRVDRASAPSVLGGAGASSVVAKAETPRRSAEV